MCGTLLAAAGKEEVRLVASSHTKREGSEREASSSFADQVDQGPAASEHVKAAPWYLERAYELPARGDPYDAAENVWAAVKSATETLTSRVLAAPVPPKVRGVESL